jgi:hypothetical protein
MSEIDELIKAYDRYVSLPWQQGLSGAEKVWFLIYDPPNERRVRFRVPDFETATKKAGHTWAAMDITDEFAKWMASHRYRESYFESPEDMEPALKDFAEIVIQKITAFLESPEVDENTVAVITGLASLFGLTRASTVLEKIANSIRGRLLVFFPGSHEGSNYRLLDARDGWNYLAIPIKTSEGE